MNNHLYAINNANYKLEIGMKVRFIGMECKNNTTNPIPSNGIGTIRSIKTSSQNPNHSALYISVWFEEWTGEANGHLFIPMVEKKIEEKKSEGIDFVELRKIWGENIRPLPVEFYWNKEPKVNLIGTITFPHCIESCYFAGFFNQTLRLNDEIVVTKILNRKDAAFVSIHEFYYKVKIGDVLILNGLSGFYKVLDMDKNNQMLGIIDLSRNNALGHSISPAKHPIVRIYREV